MWQMFLAFNLHLSFAYERDIKITDMALEYPRQKVKEKTSGVMTLEAKKRFNSRVRGLSQMLRARDPLSRCAYACGYGPG
jgi:hypothetical protein